MGNLLFQIIGGALSFWLAVRFVPGVTFTGEFKYLILAGACLGFINFFIKPIIKIVTFPLKVLTLGIFSLIVNILIVWFISLIFPELTIQGFYPLLKTTAVVWLVGYFLGLSSTKNKQ